MANLDMTFRPEDAPANEYDPLPAGQYMAQVIDSTIADTKSGNGQMLTLTWEVLAGPFEGRMLFDRLNIRNTNEKAQAIGLQQLAKICVALGIPSVSDSEELHHLPLMLDVKIQDDKSGSYGPQNQIKKYSPINGPANPPAQAQPQPRPATGQPAQAVRSANAGVATAQRAAASAPPAVASTTGGRPWEKKRVAS
jgi:hypothetical protein